MKGALWKAVVLCVDVDVMPKEICQLVKFCSLEIQNGREGSNVFPELC